MRGNHVDLSQDEQERTPGVPVPRKRGPEPIDRRWYATVVVAVYAPDVFAAHAEALHVASRMRADFGVTKVSDRLEDEDDE